MKTVNGGLLIVLAFAIIWIGVTQRFPALIAAIGLVRMGSTPKSSAKSADSTSSIGSTPPLANPSVFSNSASALNAPVLQVWQDALNSITKPNYVSKYTN